ncbi:MAG: hypothetical protein MUP66_00565 [Candidatus Nanohaloarchaeota archaeon QJJ-5]|nr:hypothetical protein [Candidatus Nanohaloarchaeota archaeon QJJ-5]
MLEGTDGIEQIPSEHLRKKYARRGSTITDSTDEMGRNVTKIDKPEGVKVNEDTTTEEDEEGKIKYAKEAIPLDRAISKKKGGHYLKCAVCDEDFEKLSRAKNHRANHDHNQWFVRFQSLKNTGIYQKMDERLN